MLPSPSFALKFHSTTLITNGLLYFYHHDHLRYQAISTIAFSGSGARDITGIAHAHVGLEGAPETALFGRFCDMSLCQSLSLR